MKRLSTSKTTTSATRKVAKAHARYRRLGNIAGRLGVTRDCESAMYELVMTLEPRCDALLAVLSAGTGARLRDGIATVQSAARNTKAIAWKIEDHVSSLERARTSPPFADCDALFDHLKMISDRYMDRIDSSKNKLAGSRARKGEIRKAAMLELTRNLWAVRCTCTGDLNRPYAGALGSVAASAFT